jgi:hypothetical protein
MRAPQRTPGASRGRCRLQARLQAGRRGYRVEAPRFALSFGTLAGLAQVQEPGGTCGEAGGGRGLDQVIPAANTLGNASASLPRARPSTSLNARPAADGSTSVISLKCSSIRPLTESDRGSTAMTGAQFEIRIDGAPRSYRDRRDLAMEAARLHQKGARTVRGSYCSDQGGARAAPR